VTLALPGTVAAITTTTGGKQHLDFTSNGGSCTIGSAFAQRATCTVDVTFSPTLAGVRFGAVELFNQNGIVLGRTYINGIGQAPQTASFSTAPESQALASADNYFAPNGLATDSGSNIYAVLGSYKASTTSSAPTYGSVVRIPGDTNAGGINANFPTDLSVDGAGNTYIYDTIPGESVLKPDGSYRFTSIPSSEFGLSDAAGNLYKTCSAGICKETLQSDGTYVQSTVTSLSSSSNLYVDGAGNVFAVAYPDGTATIYKFAPSGSGYAQSTVTTGISAVTALTADAMGNVYYVDASTNVYKETPRQNGSYDRNLLFNGAITQYSINFPGHTQQSDAANRLAVDPAGDLYYWKEAGTVTVSSSNPNLKPTQVPYYGVFKTDYSQILGFDFPNTFQGSVSGPETITITNSGNLPLQFSAVAFPADFKESKGAAACGDSTTLEANASCTLTISFAPIAPVNQGSTTTISENIVITTNTGNHPGTEQTIVVRGIELPTTPAPTFTLAAGVYNTAQTVSVYDSNPGAAFYYTLDGSTPTGSSIFSPQPFTLKVSTAETLKAIAVVLNTSPVTSAYYALTAPTPAITFTPSSGSSLVTISVATSTASVFYTTTGNKPTTDSPRYTGPFKVPAGTKIMAFGAQTGFLSSPVVSAIAASQTSAATPVFSLPAGVYNTAQTVTVTDSTPGAKIYYTLNGTTPTAASAVASGPISIKAAETLTAIAIAPGYTSSSPASSYYALTAPTPAISLTGAPGSPQTVTITTATPIEAIFYTTAGNRPTVSSTRYTGSFVVPAGTKILAISAQTGYLASSIASASAPAKE
jgi:hypothetical protein